jgi:hypothetical protein
MVLFLLGDAIRPSGHRLSPKESTDHATADAHTKMAFSSGLLGFSRCFRNPSTRRNDARKRPEMPAYGRHDARYQTASPSPHGCGRALMASLTMPSPST